jgi:ribosomal protein S7
VNFFTHLVVKPWLLTTNNMRRKVKNRNIVTPDSQYNSTKVSKFINYVMQGGKKTIAQEIVYGAFDVIKEKLRQKTLLRLSMQH